MKATAFELNKLRRLIRTQGKQYRFYRDYLNKFNEPTGDTQATEISAVYHTVTQRVDVLAGEGGSIHTRRVPMLLALLTEGFNIQQGDFVDINDITYKVTGVSNINNWNIAVDISLEEVVTNVGL